MLLIVSMRGGIMQVEKRRTVPTILQFRLFLFILEIGQIIIFPPLLHRYQILVRIS